MTTRSLAVLKNLVNSFRKGIRWTRQITGSVDLSETDCIALRHARDFRQVPPRNNGDWLRVSRCLSPFFALGSEPCLGCCFARREPLPLPRSRSHIEAVKKL